MAKHLYQVGHPYHPPRGPAGPRQPTIKQQRQRLAAIVWTAIVEMRAAQDRHEPVNVNDLTRLIGTHTRLSREL
jgi:hypothetical protein